MKKIFFNFNWLLISSLVFGFSQWILVSLLNKFSTIEMVGYYVIGLSLTAPIFILFNMNLNIVQITDQSNQYDFASFYNFRIISSLLALIFVMVLTLFLDTEIYNKTIILLICIWKLVESQIDIFYGKYQNEENMKSLAYSRISRGIVNILGISMGLFFLNDLYMALIIIVFLNLIILIIEQKLNRYPFLKSLYKVDHINKKFSKVLFITSLPLALSSFLDSMSINLQRILMGHFLSVESVGYFASMTFVMLAGNTVFSALGRAFLPMLAKHFVNNIKKFIKLSAVMYLSGLVLSLIILIVVYLFGDLILTILYTESYSVFNKEFLFIMIAATIWYSAGFINISIYATKNFKNQLYVYAITFIVIFISTYTSLIINGNLIGVAIGLIIGMATKKIVLLSVLIYIVSKEVSRNDNKQNQTIEKELSL